MPTKRGASKALASMFERAEAVSEAIWAEASQRGYVLMEARQRTLVIEGQIVTWCIGEKGKQTRVALTKEEERWYPKERPWKQVIVPSGLLSMSIDVDYSSKKYVVESFNNRFESRIGELLKALERAGQLSRIRRVESEERSRQYQVLKARRAQRNKLREGEAERWQELRALAAGWAEAERLRSFVNGVAAKMDGLASRPARVALWLNWARERIDKLDVLILESQDIYDIAIANPARRPFRTVETEEDDEFEYP